MNAEMVELLISEAKDRMANAVEHTRQEFAGVRTGRATPALIDKLPVDYYGSEVPLLQLASFTVPEARQLLVHPFDRGAMEAIEKAIRRSDVGLNPSNDGETIRLSFPTLTADRRQELVKVVKNIAEEGRISVRGARRSARQELDTLAKDVDLSEDEVARAEKSFDSVTHSYEAEIDQTLESKERELLED